MAHPLSHILTHFPPFLRQPSHSCFLKCSQALQSPPQGVMLLKSVILTSFEKIISYRAEIELMTLVHQQLQLVFKQLHGNSQVIRGGSGVVVVVKL